MDFAIVGVLSSLTILIVMWRIDLKKFMGYPAMLDAGVTLALVWALHGTLGGISAGIVGGMFFSLMITLIRQCYGYSRLQRQGLRLVWHTTPPKHDLIGFVKKPKMPKLPKSAWVVLIIIILALLS